MANEEYIFINLAGDDSGTIIGKRGQTLDALQYLTGLVINKNRESYTRVVIDSESYRAKREKTLQQLADRLGEKVVKNRRSVKLEPMNPYERKVIHSTLQNNPKVVTRSEGEEPYRRVVIELKRKG
jgi:spoIIIJ-associated protein